MKMTNKIKFLLSLLVIGTGTTGIAMGATSLKTPLAMATEGESIHQCASIHFGMDDAHLNGTVEWGNGGTITVGNYTDALGTISGITLSSYEVKSNNLALINNNGLKFHKNGSSLVLTFEESVIGCDIYATAWNGDIAYLQIGDVKTSAIPYNTNIKNSSGSTTVNYTKYHWDFERSNTIEIQGTKRVIIGDIALRLK